MSNSQKLHIPGLMKKMKMCKKTIYKYIDRKITMWYSLTCVVSDAGPFSYTVSPRLALIFMH